MIVSHGIDWQYILRQPLLTENSLLLFPSLVVIQGRITHLFNLKWLRSLCSLYTYQPISILALNSFQSISTNIFAERGITFNGIFGHPLVR